MANVLLINLSIVKFYDDDEKFSTYNPPLGLLYLSSNLKLMGHDVNVIDYCRIKFSYRELISQINKINPNLVGISTYTENIDEALKLSKSIKKKFPKIKIVFGGPHVSLDPYYAISSGYVDYILKNEGESSIIELVEALDSSGQVMKEENVNGIVLNVDNTVKENKIRKDILDLDLLPIPARELIGFNHYGNIINIITSRGCPNNCIYCAATALSGATCRVRSIENTILEIVLVQYMFKEKIRMVYILDDTFTAFQHRVFDFIKMKNLFNIDLKWRCESRVDSISEEMVEEMVKSNCVGIAFGVESGHQEVLRKIRKNITLDKVEKVVKMTFKANIYTSLNFMLGHYCDTVETMRATSDYIKYMYEKYNVGIFLTFNTPFPGTYQYNKRDELKIKLSKQSYSEYSILTPSIEGEHFSINDQLNIYRELLPIIRDNDFGLR